MLQESSAQIGDRKKVRKGVSYTALKATNNTAEEKRKDYLNDAQRTELRNNKNKQYNQK
jgi:hypothetical protein